MADALSCTLLLNAPQFNFDSTVSKSYKTFKHSFWCLLLNTSRILNKYKEFLYDWTLSTLRYVFAICFVNDTKVYKSDSLFCKYEAYT